MQRHFLDWGSSEIRWTTGGKTITFQEPNYSLERQADQTVLAVGAAASKYFGRTPPTAKLFQPFWAGVPADLGVAERAGQAILTHLGENAHNLQQWWQGRELIWAVPTSLSSVEKNWLEQLSHAWGYRKLHCVPQPVAATNFWTQGKVTQSPFWLLDLGASKTEIAVVQGNTILAGQTIRFGMASLLSVITQFVTATQNVKISEAAATQILTTLGTVASDPADLSLAIMGRSLLTQLPTTINLQAAELQPALEQALEPLQVQLQTFFGSLSADLLTGLTEQGLTVCGGGSRLTGLKNWLKTTLHISATLAKNPEIIVIDGLKSWHEMD
jgi:rod shape-determining protein MreB